MNILELCFVFVLVFTTYINASNIFATQNKYAAPTPCKDIEDCVGLVDSKCVEGFCECNSSKICEGILGQMVAQIGESCIHDNDCNIDQAQCNNGTCSCKPGYIKSSHGKSCLMISEGIGDRCEDSVQCYSKIPFSGCHQNKCMCQQHTHVYNESCYRDVELDQNCNNSAECAFVAFSECTNSLCNCIKGYVASTRGSRCLPQAEGYRSLCVDNAQCISVLGSGSRCMDGYCDCKEMYQFKNKTSKCVIDILLGEICEEHSDCHGPFRGRNRLECVLGECKCKSFYTQVDGYCISSSENMKYSLLIIIWHVFFLQVLS